MLVQYFDDGDIACVDGYSFRRDKRTGYYLSSVKFHDGKRRRLHVFVYERYIAAVKRGYDVHHADGDKTNNEPNNLELVRKSDHMREHGRRLSDEQRDDKRKNLDDNARAKAAQWHKSEEGRSWHVEHGKSSWVGREPIIYTCVQCGKEFESIKQYAASSNAFCSNKCKAAFRRASGVDNEIRICSICGKEFEANKYSSAKRCFACRGRHR